MFLAILPREYQEQLEEDPTVRTFKDAMETVTAKCRRLNQARLARLAQGRREAAVRGARASQPFVHAATIAEKPEQHDAVNDVKNQLKEMQNVMAVMDNPMKTARRTGSPSPRRDSPASWKGGACLH